MSEPFVVRSVELTGERMHAVAGAFVELVEHSWRKHALVSTFRRLSFERDVATQCRQLLSALEAVHAEFPTAMFWWKNEKSEFLGFSSHFAAASGVLPLDLLGCTDASPTVAWTRQAALYMKDDREVLQSRVPRFDILERQDREEGTVWLRTSKVPYFGKHGAGTVGGFDTISNAHAQELARQRR